MVTCFVIMGFSKKKIPNTNIEVDLDDTYNYLIKPVLKEMNLVAVNCDEQNKYAYRCDEIYTTRAINETFIRNIYMADIVIADITALNHNAIYELGLRHAMKPKSTIILCDKQTLCSNNFFDLTFNPHITYDSEKQKENSEIIKISNILRNVIEVCIKSDDSYIDSPVFSYDIYKKGEPSNKSSSQVIPSLRSLIDQGRKHIEDENYEEAEKIYERIINNYSFKDSELLCNHVLASYKKELSESNLLAALEILKKHIDLDLTTYENALGISAAIHLRLFELTNQKNDLFIAIEHYRKGSYYESGNLYCGKNYCSSLLKIYLVEQDIDILKEYYYTAVHTAKLLLTKAQKIQRRSDQYNDTWFLSNQNSLFIIATGMKNGIYTLEYQSKRQQNTIENGYKSLIQDLEQIKKKCVIM